MDFYFIYFYKESLYVTSLSPDNSESLPLKSKQYAQKRLTQTRLRKEAIFLYADLLLMIDSAHISHKNQLVQLSNEFQLVLFDLGLIF